MKIFKLFSILAVLLLLYLPNCDNGPKNDKVKVNECYEQGQVTRMLYSFYRAYISACAELNQSKVDSIQNKYCTQKLLKIINKMFEEQTLDYDPFLKSQMIDLTMLNKNTIRKDSIRENIYYFSYFRPYYNKYITIKLGILKESNNYLIDSIFLEK
jgi:hypothetical protein